MLHAVLFTRGEYKAVVSKWWQGWHGHPAVDDMLASMGIAVLDESGPVAVSYLYPAQTASIMWVGFTVADPDLSRIKAGRAIKLLIDEIQTTTRRLGYTFVYTAFDAPALIKLCRKAGFHQGSVVKEQWKAVQDEQ